MKLSKAIIEIQELRRLYKLEIDKVENLYTDHDEMFDHFSEVQADFGPRITEKFRKIFSEQFLDLPDHENQKYWERSNLDGNFSLTDKGMNVAYEKLRVRNKELENSRVQKRSMLIGILGAITGLLAVMVPVLVKLIDAFS